MSIIAFASEYNSVEYDIKSDIHKLDTNIPNNHSGIVIKTMGQNRSIIAIAKVKNGSIQYQPSDLLDQEYLPKVIENVSSGDKIIFNYLYNNAVVIAPNFKTYKKVMDRYSDTMFVDIDTLSGYLTRVANPVPTKEDFLNYAREYDIGLFYFAVGGKLYTVDARTFDIIATRNFRVTKDIEQQPFYSRVKEIAKSILRITNTDIGDYTTYYKTLLGK
jgi:hypothetical protein